MQNDSAELGLLLIAAAVSAIFICFEWRYRYGVYQEKLSELQTTKKFQVLDDRGIPVVPKIKYKRRGWRLLLVFAPFGVLLIIVAVIRALPPRRGITITVESSITWAGVPPAAPGMQRQPPTTVVIPVTVINNGDATACGSWEASIVVDGKVVKGVAPVPTPGGWAYINTDHRTTYIPDSQLIDIEAVRDPIPAGGRVVGYHITRLPVDPLTFRLNGRSLRVTCQDSDGEPHVGANVRDLYDNGGPIKAPQGLPL